MVEVPDPSRRGLRLAGAGDFTQALVGGDSGVAGSVAERALAGGLGLVDVAVGVIQPSMYAIGYLWQTNRITVAQEHLATAIA
ncbi:MAG: B12-binding domain-containing protein [Candidatus Sedimenticola endophacoides]